MRIVLAVLVSVLLITGQALAMQKVIIETNVGAITLELNQEKAPVTVKNFLGYVDRGFYDGTIFHRVIPGFMIQGGGFDDALNHKDAQPPIKNEASNGLSNLRGTIAMARTQVVDSATSQFFINLKDNVFLDHQSTLPSKYGYAVFGRVVEGMSVVDTIAAEKTFSKNPMFQNLPVKTIKILSIKRVGQD